MFAKLDFLPEVCYNRLITGGVLMEAKQDKNRNNMNTVLPLRVTLPLMVVILAARIVLWFMFWGDDDSIIGDKITEEPPLVPVSLSVIIPQNEGGVADSVVRAALENIGINANIRNISGSGGAAGINAAVTENALIGTNLSSVITAQLMGFSGLGADDFEYRFIAFSPCVVAVRAGSWYHSLEDLFARAADNRLIAANAGKGTMSFIAAYLFAEEHGIAVIHQDHPGTNPAVDEILQRRADFIIAPEADLTFALDSGELRIIESGFTFGEYYGFLLPLVNLDDGQLELLEKAAGGGEFTAFAAGSGLAVHQPNRTADAETAQAQAEIIERVLHDSDYIVH
jgi:hypothetical protein